MTALRTNPAPEEAPLGVDGFFQPRRAAFWLLLFFLVVGAFSTLSKIHLSYEIVPTAVLVGAFVWTLYAVPFLWFLRSLDVFEQHSPLGFALAFAWGGFGAVHLVIPVNDAVESLAAKLGGPEFAARWGPALAAPTNEELFKYLGVVLLVMVARTQFPTILSVVVTGATVGLGFQVMEDLVYTANTAIQFPSTNQIAPVVVMLVVRGLLGGLWSHALYTSIACFGLGYLVARPDRPLVRRIAVAVAFFLLAWSAHFFWDSPLLRGLGGGVIVLALVKGVPVLIVGYAVWYLAEREEGLRVRAITESYLDKTLVAPEEIRTLASFRDRRAARKTLRFRHGRPAARTLRRLQRAQLHLLRVCGQGGPGPQAWRAAQEVRALRADLTAITGLPAAP
ncbi:RsiW-degrading membrane proteinase PrsW (M82 family) [Actinocorallia herbida]|uniref:RsiW-degrading membrane proteinase PrsW (M82 family) n=1 Tax=Actinocorallia herbida TaxID=58109 RepID=A0A3N1D557_9ACTN|nr:PrsW family intramembrane metalloprotease [Actinocorallia herbida]ROO88657.1 RsiW-degrading membrane proteinase PrsW (M82 family) [Actinocorallia herbida]